MSNSPMHNADTSSIRHRIHIPFAAQSAFLFFAAAVFIIFYGSPFYNTVAITFSSIVLEALPFMLLGALLSGLIEVFVSRDRIAQLLPSGKIYTFFVAGALGLIFPVCECAIVPVVRRFLRKGIPLGAAISYLLAGPIVNPLVAASTAVAYSTTPAIAWTVSSTRLIYGYLIAVCIGFLMDLFFHKKEALVEELSNHNHDGHDHSDCDCHCHHYHGEAKTFSKKITSAVYHSIDEFMDVGRFLIVGAFIAALLQTTIPRSFFASSFMGSSVVAIVLMMILAMVLNLCSEADAFIAASFRSTPLPFSAQMAFMVLGPMLDIKLLLMYLKVFKKRFIIALSSSIFILVLLCMIMMDMSIQ